MRFEKSTLINASADKVFAYVSDLTNMKDWGGFTTGVRKTSDGPIAVGSTFEADGKQFGKHTDKTTVTQFSPGKRFESESHGDAGHSRNWFELEDQSGSTKLTKGMEFVKPALLTRLSSGVVKVVAPKGLVKDLAKIKANIEGSA